MKPVFALSALLLFVSLPANAAQFRALLFTKTAGWHHDSINEAVTAMRGLAGRHFFELEWHEDAARFTDDFLSTFDVIIFLNTTGDILNDEQQAAMERFIRSGKGFVGVHAAADTEYEWDWYTRLVGRMFVAHPDVQSARLSVVNRSMSGLERWPDSHWWTDEWYQFGPQKSSALSYLLSVDESTYTLQPSWDPSQGSSMGDFHPVAWYQEFDGGRSFYTGLGHMGSTWSSELLMEHLYGGLLWAATGKGLAGNN